MCRLTANIVIKRIFIEQLSLEEALGGCLEVTTQTLKLELIRSPRMENAQLF